MDISAEGRGWGYGWPSCQDSQIVVASWTQPYGTRLSVPVRHEMTALFPALINRLALSRKWDYPQYGTWGFDCRAIRGTRIPSNHSWGLAVDLDAPNNPQYSMGYGTQPHDAGAIAASLGFGWGGYTGVGGTYSSSFTDPMHYEYLGTLNQALSANIPEVYVAISDADVNKVASATAKAVWNNYTVHLTDGRIVPLVEYLLRQDEQGFYSNQKLDKIVKKLGA